MMEYLKREKWSPYLVGALIGGLLTILFVIGYQIGVSSAVARTGLLVEKMFFSSHLNDTPYARKLLTEPVVFDWKVVFIIGLFFGSWLSAKLSGQKGPKRNTIWENAYGTSTGKRYLAAFIGGVLLLFGARLADGCTSGHAISGGAQLSLVSWIFMLALFATAIPVSFALYGRK